MDTMDTNVILINSNAAVALVTKELRQVIRLGMLCLLSSFWADVHVWYGIFSFF